MATEEGTITTCGNCSKGEGALVISKHVRHVIWSSIAIEIAKLHIVPYTKRYARNVLLSYTMKLYSKSIRLVKIVQFAINLYHRARINVLLNHVVVNVSAMVVLLP